ncbi:MAG: hypothetical protein AAGN15_11115 [Cyanobacteria bacterium J06581_3]
MFTTVTPDAAASTHSTAVNKSTATQTDPITEPEISPPKLPPHDFSEANIRHLLFGTPAAVQQTVHNLHSRGYAEPNDWSPAISTGRANKVMKVLVKRLPVS